MSNTIEYAKVFQNELDKQIVEGATSGWMEENAGQVIYNGGKEIKMPALSLQGLAGYNRDDGYTDGAVTFSCAAFPSQATYRDVLGYLAGMFGACAKFDRNGRLCFKTLENCGFRILRDNYKAFTLTQDPCEIEQITFETDDGSFSAGDGSRLTTYVCYNPFGTQEIVDGLFERFENFSYHGMEIEMQGLPFLEAGDSIEVQNDSDNGVFLGIVSEIEYFYDGSLWATLTSKSKNPIDEYENASTEQSQAEKRTEIFS